MRDRAVFPGTLGAPAAAEIARFQVYRPELELAEGEVDDSLEVFERLRVCVALGVGMRRAVGVSPTHCWVGLDDLIIAPTVRTQAEAQSDVPFASRVPQSVRAAPPIIVHGGGDIRRPAIRR
jgi:hypothetical protein